MSPRYLSVLLILVLLLSSCDAFSIPWFETPPAPEPANGVSTATPTLTLTPTPDLSDSTSTPPGPLVLHVWLPPAFGLETESEASRLLQERLDLFQEHRANTRIDVRTKALDGIGGMINTLTTASVAAPLALPDLVVLPREFIETAILKGLVYPYDDQDVPSDSTWYTYAQEFGNLQDQKYALPFAGDALVLLYNPAEIEEAPSTWEAILENPAPLLFPANSPLALFTLAQYQALDGPIQDQEGRPVLDEATLARVYAFYQQASAGEQMPFWLTQYDTDEQVWQAYLDNRAPMVVTWFSHYLQNRPINTAIAPLPTEAGAPFTLATAWGWVLTNPDPARRALSTELADFLTQPDFLIPWLESAGLLPTRSDLLVGWMDTSIQSIARQISTSAHLYPSTDILNILGQALQESGNDVLKQQSDPATAAKRAADQVNPP
jgi:multiple sugar transport system substrate-binding protein